MQIFLNTGGGFNGPNIINANGLSDIGVGDFNNDGSDDLVVPTSASTTVNLFLADGTGGFGAAIPLSFPGNPVGRTVGVGDFNGDGKLDFVTAPAMGGDIVTFFGDGTGGFGMPIVSNTSAMGAGYLEVADMNGDGHLDLITNLNSNSVLVLFGDGMGAFLTEVAVPSAGFNYEVTVADVNGDGQPDIAIPNNNTNTVNMYLSTAINPFPTNAGQAIALYNSLPTNVAGYGDGKISSLATYSNQQTVKGVDANIGYHMKVGITVAANQVGTWGFRVGPDFGYGGTIVVDGVPIVSNFMSMDWNNSFTNPSQSLTGQVNLTLGMHVLEVYGFDDCCDLPGTVQFTAPGISSLWTPVNNMAINTCG
jgi:hypothetical protein